MRNSQERHANNFGIEALFPNFHSEKWVSYTLKSVLESMSNEDIRVGASVMTKASYVTSGYVHSVMHPKLYGMLSSRITKPMQMVFRKAKKHLQQGDVAYFWLSSPSEMCEYFRENGVMVVREMINCSMLLRKQELDKAYEALDLPIPCDISDDDIERERKEIMACDAVFCPNAFVKQSLIDYGYSPERCIETSYGWGIDRLVGSDRVIADDGLFTVAFVGTADVRKGAAVLLKAWAKSRIKGRLLLAGQISKEVQEKCADYLYRDDVVCLGHVSNIGTVYRSAQVFCFPSWEEGGPLVTIEAMACGAVPLVTPMGSGSFFTQSDEVGMIVPPGRSDLLAEALVSLASDKERLRYMSRNAMERAKRYEWKAVGAQRRDALITHRSRWTDQV